MVDRQEREKKEAFQKREKKIKDKFDHMEQHTKVEDDKKQRWLEDKINEY